MRATIASLTIASLALLGAVAAAPWSDALAQAARDGTPGNPASTATGRALGTTRGALR